MDKNVLETLILEKKSQREIAKCLDVSQSTIKYWLGKYELSTKQFSGLYCKDCGETKEINFYNTSDGYKRRKCKACYNVYAVERFRRYKQQAVDYKGGQCEICGYKKCLGSLDFHHIEPAKKDPLWKQMRNWKFEKIKSELDKCMLVCKNCHGEIHW